MLERHTLNLDGAGTVALKRLFCGDGTGRIGKKRRTAKLLSFHRKPALGGTAAIQMVNPHKHLTAKPIDFWLARGAVLVIAALQIGIVNDLTVGPRWLAPGLELALLIPLSVATAWTQKRARKASTNAQWELVGRNRRMVRRLAIVLTAVSTRMNFGALARLIAAILSGHGGSGQTLLLDAINIWATNVVVFALWFWALDRGGPAARGLIPEQKSDFLFTQQQTTVDPAKFLHWSPGFIDYLFWRSQTQPHFRPPTLFR